MLIFFTEPLQPFFYFLFFFPNLSNHSYRYLLRMISEVKYLTYRSQFQSLMPFDVNVSKNIKNKQEVSEVTKLEIETHLECKFFSNLK